MQSKDNAIICENLWNIHTLIQTLFANGIFDVFIALELFYLFSLPQIDVSKLSECRVGTLVMRRCFVAISFVYGYAVSGSSFPIVCMYMYCTHEFADCVRACQVRKTIYLCGGQSPARSSCHAHVFVIVLLRSGARTRRRIRGATTDCYEWRRKIMYFTTPLNTSLNCVSYLHALPLL